MSFLLVSLLAATALADTPLDGLPPAARERFEAAEGAWSKGELEAADAAYGEVLAASPDFDRALRRRCGVRLAQERLDEAITDCEKAATLVPSMENQTALSIALLHDQRPKDAAKLFEHVLSEHPDYLPAQVAKCVWASQTNEKEALAGCAEKLEAAQPGSIGSLYYQALAKIEADDLEGAEEALKTAREKGLSDDLTLGVGLRAQEAADAGGGKKKRAQREAARAWTVQDAIPALVVVGLLLTVGLLWYGREDKAAAPATPPTDPPKPDGDAPEPPPEAPPAGSPPPPAS